MRHTTYFRQFRIPEQSTGAYVPLEAADVSEIHQSHVRLAVNGATVEITALASDLFRVGLFGPGRTPDYRSEAVDRADWPDHPVKVQVNDQSLLMKTAQAQAHIQLDPLRISFSDPAGRRFAEDDPELGMGFHPLLAAGQPIIDPLGPPARLYKTHRPGERYFGCGERTGGLEKTDSHQIFWNVDSAGNHTPSLNNMYTSTPFIMALEEGQAWGLFLDNSGYVEFDLAHEETERSWFGNDTGDLVYYVFAGPTPRLVVERLTELTGRTPLPPLWALGYHQSRWGWKTAGEVQTLARELRSRDIPCDALYLDIDYMDEFRVFTWNPRTFPDPDGLANELDALGIRLVTITDPGVKRDDQFPVYQQGHDFGFFIKNSRGLEYQNVVWPGVCAFPDFNNPDARLWWGDNLKALVDRGVAGIWCDMNEPTMFVPMPQTLPPDVVHPSGGEPRLHAEVHNLYGSLMAQATREGLLRLRPDRRPFVISRSGYAGLQRHALHWTGDNTSWWEHLWMCMPQLQNLGISGLAHVGMDVGGFGGDTTGELLARWFELGAFVPFCRNHSARNTRSQDPWSFGEKFETPIRAMLKLRQRLIPYLYSLFDECNRTGAPPLRPLLFEFPDDDLTATTDDEFMLGDALLVAPVMGAGQEYRHVYLPRGTWFHYWTGDCIEGPKHILANAPLGRPALYLRGDHPLPLWPEMLHVNERPPDPLTIQVFPGEGSGVLSLYEDAGEGFEYTSGAYQRTSVQCSSTPESVRIEVTAQDGAYSPARTRVLLELPFWPAPPGAVRFKGAPHSDWQIQDGTLRIELPPLSDAWVLEIDRAAEPSPPSRGTSGWLRIRAG